jgi:ElaB/YqjD/DUF883 family membrane-anchored ribosome-binding protein
MNTAAMIATQQALIDKGAEYLGDLIAWSISAETRLSEATLKLAAEQVNLDFSYLPEIPNKLSAFKNARTKTQTQLSNQNLLIRQISNNGVLVYGFVLENKNEKDKKLRYNQLASYSFDKSNETTNWNREDWSSDNESLIDIARNTFDKWYTWSQEITSKEIRAMLTEFVKKAGVPFRERGGTYFVARSYRLELTAFRELLPLIHRENNIRWMPIAGIGDMDIIARQSLEKEVQSMSSYLDELLDPQKVSETKGSTLKNQLKVYREVEDKTKMLSELLQFRSDALTDKLAKLRQRCLNVLDEIATTATDTPEEQPHQTEHIISKPEETICEPVETIAEVAEDNLFDLGF